MTRAAPSADGRPSSIALYKIGCVSVVLFVIVGMIIPPVLLNSVDYDTELAGREILEFIGAHRAWWMWLQTLTMGSMIFMIVPLIALYPALMHVNQVWAGIGIVFAIICQVLFMAYFPIVNGFIWLADRYHETADPLYRAALVGGAEALVAQNNVYGTSDGIFALSIIVISAVMLQGVFHRAVAVLGIATGIAGIIGAFLKPTLGIHYLWWWLGVTLWLMAVGWKFYRLGWRGDGHARASAPLA